MFGIVLFADENVLKLFLYFLDDHRIYILNYELQVYREWWRVPINIRVISEPGIIHSFLLFPDMTLDIYLMDHYVSPLCIRRDLSVEQYYKVGQWAHTASWCVVDIAGNFWSSAWCGAKIDGNCLLNVNIIPSFTNIN